MTQASVTDEMVDAALKSWYLVLTKDKRADMRIALEAALSTQPKAVSVDSLVPVPFSIERTHKNQAFVTLGFDSVDDCTAFIKVMSSNKHVLIALPFAGGA